MVTYRFRYPELMVRLRALHPVLLVLLILVSIVPAAAADEPEWVKPDLTFSQMEAGSNRFTVYGTQTIFKVLQGQQFDFFSSFAITSGYDIPYGNYPVVLNGSRWVCDLPVPASFEAPYTHLTGPAYPGQYVYQYTYDQYSILSKQALFFSDFYLEPGYYEVDANFAVELYVMIAGGSRYYRPTVFTMGFLDPNKNDVSINCFPDSVHTTFELKERSQLYFSATIPSIVGDYSAIRAQIDAPYLRFRLAVNDFQYRQVDPLQVAALNDASTDASQKIDDFEAMESSWTGSMSDSFDSLNLSGFRFSDGLIAAFSFVSTLFMSIWYALGAYNIIFLFPLYLGIVLLIAGRLSKFAGYFSSRRGGPGD